MVRYHHLPPTYRGMSQVLGVPRQGASLEGAIPLCSTKFLQVPAIVGEMGWSPKPVRKLSEFESRGTCQNYTRLAEKGGAILIRQFQAGAVPATCTTTIRALVKMAITTVCGTVGLGLIPRAAESIEHGYVSTCHSELPRAKAPWLPASTQFWFILMILLTSRSR